jgi:hypothetical protein
MERGAIRRAKVLNMDNTENTDLHDARRNVHVTSPRFGRGFKKITEYLHKL